jgi:hypothetical protein
VAVYKIHSLKHCMLAAYHPHNHPVALSLYGTVYCGTMCNLTVGISILDIEYDNGCRSEVKECRVQMQREGHKNQQAA